jgi:zona occludens toxin
MPINAYTGLMGSGKSFECVVSVILPALCVGRRVVTNVDGIDNDACRAYCSKVFDIDLEEIGNVVHCTNEDVKKILFFPFGTDAETFCQPGDMVCIDEAWRFSGTDCKIIKEHEIFFYEHRHFVNEISKVSCDLVLMVQDISLLHRKLKTVVELSFRMTKIKSLGLNKVYRVEMWEGYKQTVKARVSVENKSYDAQIFPLYSSYVGGKGKELQVDKRQNILNSKKLWAMAVGVFVLGAIGIYGVMHFFDASRYTKKSAQTAQNSVQGDKLLQGTPSSKQAYKNASAVVSEVWRLNGTFQANGKLFVILSGPGGRIRVEHPSAFMNTGMAMIGEIDGERISVWSGSISAPTMLPEVPK